MEYRKLTPEEERVIVNKGTEAPFSGKYEKFSEKGIYTCKRCDARLFRSDSKFDAQCGWPSFDDAIPGAVKRVPDADGMRTEIECAKCGAHLGHVFLGEGFTPKETRYCVNSISMDFESILKVDPAKMNDPVKMTDTAIFSGGCFWGVQYYMEKVKGVISTEVGYTGGHKDHPTYKEVCSGTTGHLEAIEVVFDPAQTSFENIARLFFEIHDPTELNHQGPDWGEQYRSAVFCRNDEQKQVTQKLINLLKEKGYKVVTEIRNAGMFWKAEDYHQEYYDKNGHMPYCHGYVKRF
ncbi:MAG: bifunctional methionine sulfoxide reductase B/A protein [Bacteroidetes bacterium]|nr:bifunctional methionine sulfoxide reductase B/A protein [Bacteroidota bacterium]